MKWENSLADILYLLIRGLPIIAILTLFGAFFYFDVPNKIIDNMKTVNDDVTEISYFDYYYTGTLSTITYRNGWWNLGGIEKTTLSFLDGNQFVFSGELICQIGANYNVTLRETTFKDNHTEIEPLGLVQIN
jgi:hypothetical protein